MSTLKKRHGGWFARHKWVVAVCVLALVVLGAFAVHARLDYEHGRRVTPIERSFEDNPEAWLSHPTEWSTLISHIKDKQVSAVGFNGRYALYTLKSGEKRSATFSCLLTPDCTGMKELVQLSARNGVQFVAVNIDTSTTTEKILGVLGTCLNLGFGILFPGIILFSVWMMAASARTERVKLVERPDGNFDAVIGATNHADNVDPALRRSGRFDITAYLSNPTAPERAKLFDLYLAKVKADSDLDTEALARMAADLSPADIANIVNKAASRAAEAGETLVYQEHLFAALEAHQLGGEVNSLKEVLSPKTKHRIAVHEAGHAMVGHYLGAGSVDRVSIEPRGGSLGVTFVNRANDEPLYGEQELKARLAMMLAGREAELMMLGNTSSGASDDLKRATEMATNMVGSLGFGPSFGLLSVAGLSRELMGPDVQRAVLEESRTFLNDAQRQARRLLVEERDRLERLVALLLEEETVGGAALKEVLGVLPVCEPIMLLAA